MRNDGVLIPSFVRGARCLMFSIVFIFVFLSTTIRQLYTVTKMPTFGSYEYREEGSGCGFNRKQGRTMVFDKILYITHAIKCPV